MAPVFALYSYLARFVLQCNSTLLVNQQQPLSRRMRATGGREEGYGRQIERD